MSTTAEQNIKEATKLFAIILSSMTDEKEIENELNNFVEGIKFNLLSSPSLAATVSEEHWISIKERLPENNGQRVLGWDKISNKIQYAMAEDIHQMSLRFSHWMPLPSPPNTSHQ